VCFGVLIEPKQSKTNSTISNKNENSQLVLQIRSIFVRLQLVKNFGSGSGSCSDHFPHNLHTWSWSQAKKPQLRSGKMLMLDF
jgi:hypothetical protein